MQERIHGGLRAEIASSTSHSMASSSGRPPVQPKSKAIHRVCGRSRSTPSDQGGGDPRNISAHPFLSDSSPGDQEVAGGQLRARRKIGISEPVSSPSAQLDSKRIKKRTIHPRKGLLLKLSRHQRLKCFIVRWAIGKCRPGVKRWEDPRQPFLCCGDLPNRFGKTRRRAPRSD